MSTNTLEAPSSTRVLPTAKSRPMEVSRHAAATPFGPVAPSSPRDAGLEFWVESISSVAELDRYRDAWQDLGDQATDANPFYEPWSLLPALNAFGDQYRGIRFLFVWRKDPRPNQWARLAGFVPVTSHRSFGRFPVRHQRVWQHPYCYCCAPLLRRGVEREALTALFDWLADQRQGRLELHHVPADGGFAQALTDIVNHRSARTFLVEKYNRAMLLPSGSFEDYATDAMSNHTRQELRRQQRRLAAIGHLETRLLCGDRDHGDLDLWLQQFLELESAGWKGREQTALDFDPRTREFFESMCRQAHPLGKLMMLGLFLDDKPIALKCNFLSGSGSYAFKIAFDESYSKYSPGVLLEVENIRLAMQVPGLKWMDSCAVPHHPMINRIWSERRTIQKLVVSPGGFKDNLAVNALATFVESKRMLKRCPKRSRGDCPPK